MKSNIGYNIIMKIVIDTNVFVSALISRNGASNKLLVWLFDNEEKINVVSNSLLTEIEDVLLRDKNMGMYSHFTVGDIKSFVDDIASISYHQNINFLWRPFLNDQEDDMVLETAFNASADFVVTHNIKDFKKIEESFNIGIKTPKEFLQMKGVIQ